MYATYDVDMSIKKAWYQERYEIFIQECFKGSIYPVLFRVVSRAKFYTNYHLISMRISIVEESWLYASFPQHKLSYTNETGGTF